jgi:hypothetical protein
MATRPSSTSSSSRAPAVARAPRAGSSTATGCASATSPAHQATSSPGAAPGPGPTKTPVLDPSWSALAEVPDRRGQTGDWAKDASLWPNPSRNPRKLAENFGASDRASAAVKPRKQAKVRASERLDRTQQVARSSPSSRAHRRTTLGPRRPFPPSLATCRSSWTQRPPSADSTLTRSPAGRPHARCSLARIHRFCGGGFVRGANKNDLLSREKSDRFRRSRPASGGHLEGAG